MSAENKAELNLARRHLTFIHGFNEMTRGIYWFMTMPVYPIYWLFHKSEKARDRVKRAALFLPAVFYATFLFPVWLIFAAIAKKSYFEPFKEVILPFIGMLPIFLITTALQIPALVLNYTLSLVVWLGGQVMSALFGLGPKTDFFTFFNEEHWQSKYNYYAGKLSDEQNCDLSLCLRPHAAFMDDAPGINLLNPGKIVKPKSDSPSDGEDLQSEQDAQVDPFLDRAENVRRELSDTSTEGGPDVSQRDRSLTSAFVSVTSGDISSDQEVQENDSAESSFDVFYRPA